MNLFENILRSDSQVMVLTGAGVSTNSGIPDYKTLDENWPFEEDRFSISSLPYFLQEPEKFWEAHRYIFDPCRAAEPNEFHYSLAELENKVASVNVFTQNVDGLHQKAGNSQVTEMHGNANQVICIGRNSGCRRVFKTSEFDHMDVPLCPDCNIPLKPNVSLFMEGINGLAAARNSLETSDVIDCWNIVECWSS